MRQRERERKKEGWREREGWASPREALRGVRTFLFLLPHAWWGMGSDCACACEIVGRSVGELQSGRMGKIGEVGVGRVEERDIQCNDTRWRSTAGLKGQQGVLQGTQHGVAGASRRRASAL
jgi:hypothetical protein